MTRYAPAVQPATASVLQQTLSVLGDCLRPSLHWDIRRLCQSDDELYASAVPATISSPTHYKHTYTDWLIYFKALHPIRHKISYFGDVLPRQCLGWVLKKPNQTQQKQTCIHDKIYYNTKLTIKTAARFGHLPRPLAWKRNRSIKAGVGKSESNIHVYLWTELLGGTNCLTEPVTTRCYKFC